MLRQQIIGLVLALAVLHQVPAQPVDDPASRPLAAAVTLIESGELGEAESVLRDALAAGTARPYLAWHLLGRAQLLSGRPQAAVDFFVESLARAPRFVPALLGKARAELRLGRVDSAEADLRRAISFDDAPAAAQLLLAEILLGGRDIEEGRALLAALISDSPASEGDLQLASRMLYLAAAGRPEDLVALRVLVGENPHLAAGYLALGLHQCRLGAPQGCEHPLRIALEMDDQDPTPWLVMRRLGGLESVPYPAHESRLPARIAAAQASMRAGDTEGAEGVALEILAARPHHVPAQLLVIGAAERRGDYWEALAGYRRLLAWLPRLPAWEAGAARLALAMSALEPAELWARRALETSPLDGSLHGLLARILADAGEADAAVAASREAIALGEESAEVYLTLGRVHFERMQMGEATAAYRRALELDPSAAERIPPVALSSMTATEGSELQDHLETYLKTNPESRRALYNLGVMALRVDDLAAAETYFGRLSTLDPEDVQTQYNLGQIYSRRGDGERSEAAMSNFRRLKAEEDERWLAHNQAFRRRLEAEEEAAAGRARQAVEIYSELAAVGTATTEDYLAAGRLLLQIEDYRAARSWFEGILSKAPYYRRAIEGLIEASLRGGRPEQAELYLQRLELLSPE